jgi:pimeloyl-ACP methyl ester carboxylesterase
MICSRQRLERDHATPRATILCCAAAPKNGTFGIHCTGRPITEPAWKAKPSWYLVATDDRMIPPAAQRLMAKRADATVADAKGSHAIYVSQPKAVAELIEKAAMSLSMK